MSCLGSFVLAYVNLTLYSLLCAWALCKNWDNYACGVLTLILAPLFSILISTYMVTYYWWMQGKRITCIAYGSHAELVSRDLENAILYIVQSIFIFTMYKVIERVTAPNRAAAIQKGKRTNRKMILFTVSYFLFSCALYILKAFIFRWPN